MNSTQKFLDFIKVTELLKTTLRHAWTSNAQRQESTAEHTWHLLLMAMVLAPNLKHKVDLFKVMKMLTIHDLGEAIMGDIPAFADRKNKYQKEKKAIKKITQPLSKNQASEILELWEEFEQKNTPEAVFAKTLDVIDVTNQHLISDLSTWAEIEYTFNLNRRSEKYFLHEPYLWKIYDSLHQQLQKKVKQERLSP